MKWVELSKTPRDMDFAKSMDVSARNIAAACGVPFPLISPAASTFSNMETAQEMLWENTVLPVLDKINNALGNWLAPQFKSDDVSLRANAESVPALEGKRQRKFNRMKEAVIVGLISRDEARREIGFDERGGLADELLVPSGQVPLESQGEVQDEAVAKALAETGYTEEEARQILRDEFNIVEIRK